MLEVSFWPKRTAAKGRFFVVSFLADSLVYVWAERASLRSVAFCSRDWSFQELSTTRCGESCQWEAPASKFCCKKVKRIAIIDSDRNRLSCQKDKSSRCEHLSRSGNFALANFFSDTPIVLSVGADEKTFVSWSYVSLYPSGVERFSFLSWNSQTWQRCDLATDSKNRELVKVWSYCVFQLLGRKDEMKIYEQKKSSLRASWSWNGNVERRECNCLFFFHQ